MLGTGQEKAGPRETQLGAESKHESSSASNDNADARVAEDEDTRLFDDVVMGLRLYSRLPTGDAPHRAPRISRVAMALPFTSILIGLGPALALLVLVLIGVPPLFASGLAVAAWVLATGAMSEDALADAADGLFGGATRERRLEILKDSRHGTYGVSALVLLLLLRVAALSAIATVNAYAAAALWLAAGILSRSASLWLTVRLPPARTDGLSASSGRLDKRAFALGLFFAAVLGFILIGPFAGVVGYVVALVFTAGTALGGVRLCARLVGGQTGDLIGALQAVLEIAAWSAFILAVGS